MRRLETTVPLDTLRLVVDLAVEIGRDGREGKPVGSLFVVGNHRKVMQMSHEQVHDPFRGYNKKERMIRNPRVRESIKEIAQLDGAFVISADGIVCGAGRNIDAPAEGLTLSKGLGSRHWAAAAISKACALHRDCCVRIDGHGTNLSKRSCRAADRADGPRDEMVRRRDRTPRRCRLARGVPLDPLRPWLAAPTTLAAAAR